MDQQLVLGRLGRLAVLRGRSDLRALANAGFPLRPHGFASVRGLGVTVASPRQPAQPGDPSQLFYAPRARGKRVTDPRRPDFPYRLVGWGYEVPFAPAHFPGILPCVGGGDWRVQERGIYERRSGRFRVMPPGESSFGQATGGLADAPALRPVVGFPSPRAWVAHLWLRRGGAPASAALDPGRRAVGLDPGRGSRFYDLDTPAPGVLEPSASGVPTAVQEGEGLRTKAAGGRYTVKSSGFHQGASVTVLEAELSERSRRPERGPLGHDEGWYLLDGKIEFKVGSQTLPASKGAFVYLPAGADYTFRVPEGTARAVFVTASGGGDRAGAPKPFVLLPGEGEELTIGGSEYRLKATSADTGGSFSLVEIDLRRGSEPIPHIHHKEIESFYLADGEMTFQSAGQTLPVQTGGAVQLPIGVPHSYGVTGDGAARVLLVAVPAGLEELFRLLDRLGGRPPTAAQAFRSGVEPIQPPGAGGG